jgi:hypothetical protein
MVVSRAIEVMPTQGWHKGTVVEMLLTRHLEVLAGYFGDAANDEVRDGGGIGNWRNNVGSLPGATAMAQFQVADPPTLTHWLEEVIDTVHVRRAGRGVSSPSGSAG